MNRFELNEKQLAALDRFEKAAKELNETGVVLLFDYDYLDVSAFALPNKEQKRLDRWDNCEKSEKEEEQYEIVTNDIYEVAVSVNCPGIFIDSDSVLGLLKETKEQKTPKPLVSGCWHGQDAYVLAKSGRDVEVILVGGYTEEEAREAKKLLKADSPEISKYGDDIVYVENPDEWDEQND